MGDSRWIELQVPGAEKLKAKGVEFTEPPKREPWGEHVILKDSEGNLVFGTA